ncbi:FtsB family cell division protein [Demequina sediminicola]|uniref:FtsB family cell division protein n=1 Tax=Demequina sediminicola TaxID=1095026 RepID=UPI000780DE9B|nr:septum formation initiator family protein [Demequina sediminicola]
MLTWRTGVIVLVVILSFVVVTPTVRAYWDQQATLEDLRVEAAQAQAEVDDLNAHVARWEDPAYVVAQARERLTYVFEGETPYRVVDPEFVTDGLTEDDAEGTSADAGSAFTPWYDSLWDSVIDAGGEPVVEDVGPSPEPAPQDSDDEESPLTDVDFGG